MVEIEEHILLVQYNPIVNNKVDDQINGSAGKKNFFRYFLFSIFIQNVSFRRNMLLIFFVPND
jgi:hypothetical protein